MKKKRRQAEVDESQVEDEAEPPFDATEQPTDETCVPIKKKKKKKHGEINQPQDEDLVEQPTDETEQPTDVAQQPTDLVEQPTDETCTSMKRKKKKKKHAEIDSMQVENVAEQSSDVAEQPSDVVEQLTEIAEQPTDETCTSMKKKKKKKKHAENDPPQDEDVAEQPTNETPSKVVDAVTTIINREDFDNSFVVQRKKAKQVYSRVNVDPSRQYHTPESRESWGPNVKGKKFRKEKGKKKRCQYAGVRIDGAVNSVRLDA